MNRIAVHGRTRRIEIVRFDDASDAGGYTHYSSRLVKLIEQAVAATAG